MGEGGGKSFGDTPSPCKNLGAPGVLIHPQRIRSPQYFLFISFVFIVLCCIVMFSFTFSYALSASISSAMAESVRVPSSLNIPTADTSSCLGAFNPSISLMTFAELTDTLTMLA